MSKDRTPTSIQSEAHTWEKCTERTYLKHKCLHFKTSAFKTHCALLTNHNVCESYFHMEK